MNDIIQTAGPERGAEARPTSRRGALSLLGAWGAGLAVTAAVPAALTALARPAMAQGTPTLTEILNFALTLEELEAEFYTKGLQANGLIPAADRPIFEVIQEHEVAHVQLLRTALGSNAVAKPTFDFTGGNGSGSGPFNPFQSYAVFKVLAQGFEDLGVRAYKGQAANLLALGQRAVLATALAIHSVEARHASEVRRLRGDFSEQAPFKGWITLRQVDAAAQPIAPVYGPGNPASMFPAEDNVTQGGVNVASLQGVPSAAAASESFDEPLDMQTVLTLADPFIAG